MIGNSQKVIKVFGLLISTIFILTFAATKTVKFEVKASKAGAVQSRPELVTQTGHNSSVSAIVFDPKNQWIATGSIDNKVIIWEATTGRELRTLQGHEGAIRAIAGSQDGRLLASAGNDKIVKIWDVQTSKDLQTLSGHSGMIESLSFTRDGRFLASGSRDNSIIIWDAASGQPIYKFPDAGSVKSLAFSPNGLFLASGGSDQAVKIWDIAKQRFVKTLNNPSEAATLQYSSDGEHFASGSSDGTVRIWKTVNWRETATLADHKTKILSLLFLENGQLVSASEDRNIKTWDIAKRQVVKSVVGITENTDNKIVSATISKDGQLLAVGDGTRTAAIFDISNGEEIKTFENRTFGYYCLSFSSDGHWLAAGSIDNSIKIWDLETGQSLPPLKGHQADITAIAFDPDSKRLISSSKDGTIRIWNLVTGEPPQILKAQNNNSSGRNDISTIAVSKNGRFILSGGLDKTVRLWDLETNSEIYSNNDHLGEVTAVAFSPDNNMIVSGSADKTIKLRDLNTKNLLLNIDNQNESVESIAFSPNEKLIAVGGVEKTVRIWNVQTGKNVHTFEQHSGKVNDLSFSPDGNHLASGSQDKTIRIWNVSSGKEEKVLRGHGGFVKTLSFSPGGEWLASGSDDGSIIIWRKDTGENLATLISLRNSNDWLVVTPQGLFDGSPESWNQLIWRFEKNTFNIQPVEIFFNEFYYPSLLSELLSGKPIPKTIDISKKDRRQPQVKIERVDNQGSTNPTSARFATVKIEVTQAPADTNYQAGSGARDVRIFRNGSLVKLWDENVLAGKGDRVELEATIPLVYGQNQLTAYAFNNDNIKSSDYTLNIIGAENLKRKGVLYIVGIAVGKNSNPVFDLSNIDVESVEFAKQLTSKQLELNQFERIEIVPLLNEAATKKNILMALKVLTGTKIEGSSYPIPEFTKLRAIQPEDTVVVYFTGHGTSQNNHFYMLPYDLGNTNSSLPFNEQLKLILNRSISDLELRDVFKDIDANRLLLVIDACNSGQLIESEDTRQGPMNAKGLAQLAFDKGMFILTASQSQEEAYVSKYLKRSYLTYALIEDGLKSAKADVMPLDGKLSLKEWFDYAEVRVPQLREKYGKISQNDSKGVKEEVEDSSKKEKKIILKTQKPRAFYRRQMELQPMIVAKVGSNS